MWLGWGVGLIVVHYFSWIVTRKFSNPTNRSLCVALGTLVGAGIGREAARHFLGGGLELGVANRGVRCFCCGSSVTVDDNAAR